MLLRPFYPIDKKFSQHVTSSDLVGLLTEIPSSTIRKRILKYLNIRQLIVLLCALTKDEKQDDFFNFNELRDNFKSVWIDVVDVLNNFPCVKLVDTYNNKLSSTSTNGSSSTSISSAVSSHSFHSITNLSSFTSSHTSIFNNTAVEFPDWYELSIDSNEYDFLLEYLFDSKVNKIVFPLIEIATKKFNKIYEVLENHCISLKIRNDNLSVIKDSENFKSKLKILTLINYEHFETVEKLKYETLNVVGNEVDLFSVSTIIKNNENLKIIYFKGRLKDYIPLNIPSNILVFYDLIVFDTIDRAELTDLGNPSRLNSLYLNFTLESNLSLNWLLKNCFNLKNLYLALNFETTTPQVLSVIKTFNNLETLTLKNCKLEIDDESQTMQIQDQEPSLNQIKQEDLARINWVKNCAPYLQSVTLIGCEVGSDFFNSVCGGSILSLALINCDIKFKSFVKISNYMKGITIINQDVEKCKDLVFLSFKKRSSFKIPISTKCMININEKFQTIKIPESHDLFFAKLNNDYDNSAEHNTSGCSIDNIDVPYNSVLHFALYPNFTCVDFGFLKPLVNKFDIFKVIIEIYSFTNTFFEPLNIEGIPKVEIFKFDVTKLQSHFKKILAKKEQEKIDKKFILPYPCSLEGPAPKLSLLPYSKSDRHLTSRFKGHRGKSSRSSSSINDDDDKNAKRVRFNKQNGSGRRIHSCQICGKHFSRSTALNRHLLVHGDYRPFKCDDCGFSFKRSDHLKVHKRVCVGSKPNR